MAHTTALAAYKDLCIDAVDAPLLGRFWAGALDLDLELLDDGDATLTGPTPQHTVWVNTVEEPVTVKQRLHLDVRRDVARLIDLGAEVVDDQSFGWVVLRDPEGGELCAMRPREGKPEGMYELGVDTGPDARSLAEWWGRVLGAPVEHDEAHGLSSLSEVPRCPFEHVVFVPVREPKRVKNRIHPDVTVPSDGGLDALLAAGARVVRPRDDEIGWHVLTDPAGNEFCAFEV